MPKMQSQLRVLVVDDNADFADSLSMLLRKHGYDAQLCVDAKDCIPAVAHWHPDIVLLDLGMPKITGYEIAEKIKLHPEWQHIPLVAVTGHGQPLDRLQTDIRAFDQHLVKPVNFKELDTILKAVQKKRYGREAE